MSKDYLCKNCKENNNGWCKKLSQQGLKQIIECEHHNPKGSIHSEPVQEEDKTDMLDIIEDFQKPIKSVTLDERLEGNKGFVPGQIVNLSQSNEFKDHYKLLQARALIEGHYEWRKWCNEIPYIKFPGNWEVKAIPPFGGAIIRYVIRHENSIENNVSIYLDCYGELGAMDQPYWELYPDTDDNTVRFYINETDLLLDKLHEILDRFN